MKATDGSFRVLRAGPLSTLQDQGRMGHFRQGVTVGGAMDNLSFNWANRLVGNGAGTSALEILSGNLCLEATGRCTVAITGAEASITLNGQAIESWRGYPLLPGDCLAIDAARQGLWLYLAVSGGFAVNPTLGSTSTVIREKLGGLRSNGIPIQKGDVLPFTTGGHQRCFYLPPELRPAPQHRDTPLRLIPWCRNQGISRDSKKLFYRRQWHLSQHCDRMGYRLEGTALASTSTPLLSEGITAGTVQLPPSGLPIVMMADHQTIGGYPKLGTLISQDLWRLAQMPAGSEIRFQPVTLHHALHLANQQRRVYQGTCPIAL